MNWDPRLENCCGGADCASSLPVKGAARPPKNGPYPLGIEILPTLEDVVAQSHFIFSFVLPLAAVDVAQQYLHCSHLHAQDSIFVEGNSIGLEAMGQIALEPLRYNTPTSCNRSPRRGWSHPRLAGRGYLRRSAEMKIGERNLSTYPSPGCLRVGEIGDTEQMGWIVHCGLTHQASELIRLTASLEWKQVESRSPPDICVMLTSAAKAFPLEDQRGALLGVPIGIE